MENELLLNEDDVHIRRIERKECSECEKDATHYVTIDLRTAGIEIPVEELLCKFHAEDLKERIASGIWAPSHQI